MLSSGDEVARSQQGNNNGYCQDNELSWFDWDLGSARQKFLEFTSHLIHFKRQHPNLRRRKFFQDRTIRGSVKHDIAWYGADGKELSDASWSSGWIRSLALFLNGTTLDITDEEGRLIVDESFLILINAAADGVEFTIPPSPAETGWTQVLNTEDGDQPFQATKVSSTLILGGRTVRVLSDVPQ